MIVMNETRKGSRDGIKVQEFVKGQSYSKFDLGQLLHPWLANGVCSWAAETVEIKIERQVKPQNPIIERAVIESVEKKQTVKRGRPKKGAN